MKALVDKTMFCKNSNWKNSCDSPLDAAKEKDK